MRILIISGLIITFAFASCEKVIDVALKDSEKQYVIEGTVTNRPGDCTVRVSKTKNFSDSNDFEGIANASVSVTDNEGHTTTLAESTAGIYQSAVLTATTGKTYTLHVQINGETFTASCTMPVMVNMDSLYIQEESFFGERIKLANVQYTDPPGKGNHYRFIQYVNGVKEKSIFIRDDDYSDGNTSTITLFTPPDDEKDIKSGNTVKVEMQCIAPALYKYWFSLDQGASGGSNSASPANPVTNIEGGALGYFSVHTVQSETVEAP
ncbi:DUF4249 domain-containing protein [Agriterribacter sp.]|uniref:DUF4249 domain-containing protein n=1 Tax=Agriterribacter sp. TaxID=2821509 RepID=UPI002D038D14|nr:DUF4249 domain-containing protein [Agriterribacter sp.]HRO48476.1 DUF4249 domain-containing protein [Agriterribacter sp.]HRQ19607.1 DUF4249 domain-containing protein [Agriterribacter sp.]